MAKEDFFAGIEIGDGDVFDSKKLTLNRNIKHKAARQLSPARRTATTLTFTNKLQPGLTRIPKPSGADRTRPKLEPVSESGGPIPKYQRSQSRVGGHSSQPSGSNIPAPSTPSSSHLGAPSTPSRRGLSAKSSRDNLRTEGTTNPAQYLRAKRSMPALRNQQPSPSRPQTNHQRPPSQGELGSRHAHPSRPKTPVDRSGAESSLGSSRKPPVPFLPAGTLHAQSHHVNSKPHRQFNRPHSSDSNEPMPLNRPLSRLSNPHHRPATPPRRDLASDSLAREAASKHTLTKPTRRRAFGDGTELEVFDDLPTSASTESRFVRQPARVAPRPTASRTKLNSLHPTRSTTSLGDTSAPATQSPLSPTKSEAMPRFARDTNASRLAREQRIGSVGATLHANLGLPTVREGGPLTSIGTNWKAHVAAKGANSPNVPRPKRAKVPPRKPQLIKPMGDGANTPKSSQGGMRWNSTLFKWEGNENALASFDAPIPPPRSPKYANGNGGSKAAPALIANVGASKGVQVVGGMVFDPQRMCWLKMAPSHAPQHRFGRNASPRSTGTLDDDEDPFAGLDDLDEGKDRKNVFGHGAGPEDDLSSMGGSKGLADDEWLVGEEFDVGPEFIKRQRTEEENWRRKVAGWVGKGIREAGCETGYEGEDWRGALRDKLEKVEIV